MMMLLMGILNVTPDSFSDGGKYTKVDLAVEQARQMVAEGADIIDVGGESTRPGALEVDEAEEIRRVVPVLTRLSREVAVRLSIDTRKSAVARAALDAGATLINDVSGGRDIGMVDLVKRPGIEMILMHMMGTPETMQKMAQYPDGVVSGVAKYLKSRVANFQEAGVDSSKLWVDPGIGFGKTVDHCLDLLRHLDAFKGIGSKLVIGTSRKSFLAKVMGKPDASPEERDEATLTTNLWALTKGCDVFRVHQVSMHARAMKTWSAIQTGNFSPQ